MQVISKNSDVFTISASLKEFARLGKLLDWIVDSQQDMDEGRILLEQEEIDESIRDWLGLYEQVSDLDKK